jgi:hypothetical protein
MLTLLFLVLAILVPVALLVGFAGCDRVFGLTEITPTLPMIDSATGKDGTTIALVWHWAGTPQKFQFERTDPDGNVANFDAPYPPESFPDTGLAPATTYSYRVRGVFSNGDTSDWSSSVPGTTLPLVSTYSKSLTGPEAEWEGYTLVQRIEVGHLSATGPHVRITVQASSAGDASIDKIYISQASSSGNPWDPAGDLTAIYDSNANQNQPFPVPAGMTKPLPIVAYAINRFQALLISIDFTAGPASGVPTGPASAVERAPAVPMSEAATYYLLGAEASKPGPRSANYTLEGDMAAMTSQVTFITNIEVG